MTEMGISPFKTWKSYASRLLEANVQAKIVQELLGHSSIRLTLDTYSHVLLDIKLSAVTTIDDLFETSTQNEDSIKAIDKSLNKLFEI